MRLKELDSLRGLAALAVSYFHAQALAVGAIGTVLSVLALTPLHAIFDAGRAVVFFFVLSGFVLAVPFFRGGVSPIAFVVKRMARIYPAYWAVLLLAVVAYVVAFNGLPAVGGPAVPCGLTFCTNPRSVTAPFAVVNFIILFGEYTATVYDPVVWSLVHELRLSILFPLIVLPVVRFPSRWVLLFSAPLIAAGFWVPGSPSGSPVPLFGPVATIFFAWFFVIGAVAAKHIDQLVAFARAMSARRAALWLCVTLLIYGSLPVIGFAFPLEEAAVGASTIGLMVLGLSRPGLSRLLLSPALRFVGRIAYSYYLLHLVIFELAAHFLYGPVPNLVIVIVGIAVSLALAALAYRWVEVPSIRIGHALYLRIQRRMAVPAPVTP